MIRPLPISSLGTSVPGRDGGLGTTWEKRYPSTHSLSMEIQILYCILVQRWIDHVGLVFCFIFVFISSNPSVDIDHQAGWLRILKDERQIAVFVREKKGKSFIRTRVPLSILNFETRWYPHRDPHIAGLMYGYTGQGYTATTHRSPSSYRHNVLSHHHYFAHTGVPAWNNP